MIEHVAAIAFLLVIVGFSAGAIWLNYRLHALEVDRASDEVFESAAACSVADGALAATGA